MGDMVYEAKRREFLSEDQRKTDFIVYEVEVEQYSKDSQPDILGYLTVADGSHVVNLESYVGSYEDEAGKELEAALTKVRLVRQLVNEFADHFETAAEKYRERAATASEVKRKREARLAREEAEREEATNELE
jgi:hypothetical protein